MIHGFSETGYNTGFGVVCDFGLHIELTPDKVGNTVNFRASACEYNTVSANITDKFRRSFFKKRSDGVNYSSGGFLKRV